MRCSAVAGVLNYLYVYDPTFEKHAQEQEQQCLLRQEQRQLLQQQQQHHQQDQVATDVTALLAQPGSSSSSAAAAAAAAAAAIPAAAAPVDAVGGEGVWATVGRLCREVASVLRIPSFVLIIVQGIVGSVPYASLVFLTLYFQAGGLPACCADASAGCRRFFPAFHPPSPRLPSCAPSCATAAAAAACYRCLQLLLLQLMGMSNGAASLLVALYLLGGGLGGLLGGWIGDCAAARFPSHGRIAATQFSVILGVPFSLLLTKVWCVWVCVCVCVGGGGG